MSQYKDVEVGSTVYFWFAANLTTGAAGDGASPLYDVRAAGGAAGGAPTASGTPTLLTHASYTDGLHEIAIDTTGYNAGEYAVFCTLTISTVNPAGFCGSFKVVAVGDSLHSAAARVMDAIPNAAAGANGGLPTTNGTKLNQTADLTAGQTIAANLTQILGTALTETAGLIAAGFKKFFNIATPTGTLNSLPDAVPGAAGGLPTTNGTKVNQTVDLTAGQSIAASSVPAVTLANGAHGGAGATITLQTPIVANATQIEGGDATDAITAAATAATPTVTAGAVSDKTGYTLDAAYDPAKTAAQALDLATVAGYIDTEVTAIKLQTDKLNFTGTDVKATLDGETVALTAGQLPIKKNTAFPNFEFPMLDSTDHVTPTAGLTVTAQRSIDGGAFGACTNAVAELSNGLYKHNWSASDLNGAVTTFRYTAVGADDRLVTVVTQA